MKNHIIEIYIDKRKITLRIDTNVTKCLRVVMLSVIYGYCRVKYEC